jgi:hypothetical protein
MKSRYLTLAIFVTLLAACSGASLGAACDEAQFIEHVIYDVPVQQGTLVMPGTHFTKGWQVRNAGTCDWSTEYSLLQTSGPELGEEQAVPLHDPIAAGTTSDILVRLTAPSDPGTYTAEWMLQNAAGELFGVGPGGDRPLTMEIVVADLPAPIVYDFAQAVCLAEWHSARAEFLPCEGLDDEQGIQDGYVRLNSDPALEGSTRGNPPVIEVKPNNQTGGWIAGYFPPTTIREGDHFLATIGCLDDNPGCEIIFRLEYESANGDSGVLAEWFEFSDEVVTEVEKSLSDLAGQEVRLILVVQENDGRSLEAKGFWLNARIERR